MAKPLIFNAARESYSIEGIKTLTVGELIKLLEDFDEARPVVFAHDNGYTYGGITEFHLWEDEE